MDTEPILIYDRPSRIAVAAAPAWLNISIPPDAVGVYMLLRGGRPFYVGRSDSCVRTRLRGHPWLRHASHVVWEPCTSAEQAFRHESAWYHILEVDGNLCNMVHPAHPAHASTKCPFCDTGDFAALELMLPHLRQQSVGMASLTQVAVSAKTNFKDN